MESKLFYLENAQIHKLSQITSSPNFTIIVEEHEFNFSKTQILLLSNLAFTHFQTESTPFVVNSSNSSLSKNEIIEVFSKVNSLFFDKTEITFFKNDISILEYLTEHFGFPIFQKAHHEISLKDEVTLSLDYRVLQEIPEEIRDQDKIFTFQIQTKQLKVNPFLFACISDHIFNHLQSFPSEILMDVTPINEIESYFQIFQEFVLVLDGKQFQLSEYFDSNENQHILLEIVDFFAISQLQQLFCPSQDNSQSLQDALSFISANFDNNDNDEFQQAICHVARIFFRFHLNNCS
jgi:hypothetical protein